MCTVRDAGTKKNYIFSLSVFLISLKKYKRYSAYMQCKIMSQLKTPKFDPQEFFFVFFAMSQRCAIFGHSTLAVEKKMS